MKAYQADVSPQEAAAVLLGCVESEGGVEEAARALSEVTAW